MSTYTVSPEFAPDEPLPLLRAEEAFFIEIAFESVFYGMTAVLFFLTIRSFLINHGFKHSWKMISFLTVQHIAVFIGVFGNIHFAVLAFVYNRNIPGGPTAFQNEFSNLPVPFAALAGFTIGNWFQDALLLWRFLVIWDRNYKLFALPFMLFLTSIAFSLIFFVDIGPHPGLFGHSGGLGKTILIYFSLSVGLNFVLTLLIALRLLYFRQKSVVHHGPSHPSSKRVFSVVTMVVESAALYTMTGIAQIVAIPLNPTVQVAISGLYGVMPAFATVLIAYRVSQGQAWTKQTVSEQSELRYTPNRSNPTSGRTTLGAGSTTIPFGSRDDIPLQTHIGSQTHIKDVKVPPDPVDGSGGINVVTMSHSDFTADSPV